MKISQVEYVLSNLGVRLFAGIGWEFRWTRVWNHEPSALLFMCVPLVQYLTAYMFGPRTNCSLYRNGCVAYSFC